MKPLRSKMSGKYTQYKVKKCYVKLHRIRVSLKNKRITNVTSNEKCQDVNNYLMKNIISHERTGDAKETQAIKKNTINLDIARNLGENYFNNKILTNKLQMKKCRVVLRRLYCSRNNKCVLHKSGTCTRQLVKGPVSHRNNVEVNNTVQKIRKFFIRNNTDKNIANMCDLKNSSKQNEKLEKFLHKNTQSNVSNIDLTKTDIYQFSPQGNKSEKDNTSSDVVKKLIKEGKATLIKHKGRVYEKRKRKKTTRDILRDVNKNLFQSLGNINLQKKNVRKHSSNSHLNIEDININNKIQNLQSTSKILRDKENNEPAQNQLKREAIKDKQKLLQIAKDFVYNSTPKNKYKSAAKKSSVLSALSTSKKDARSPHFSPILTSSPWRVYDEHEHVFQFNRHRSNLSSNSSNATPLNQKENSLNESMKWLDSENIPPSHRNSQVVKTDRISSVNNKSPEKLKARSPLKAINILDVITLPNRTHVVENQNFNNLELSRTAKVKFNDTVKSNSFEKHEHWSTDYFGFEEAMDDDVEKSSKVILSKDALKEKLKSLATLLPPKENKVTLEHATSIYNEPKQKTIKEMFSSTWNKDQYKKEVEDDSIDFLNKMTSSSKLDKNDSQEISFDLFDDVESVVHFDVTKNRKSYSRTPMAKKRKYSFIISSDDDFEDEKELKRKHNKPNDKKHEIEFNKFCEEFNAKCEEIERYKLPIEKEKQKSDES